MGVTTVDSLATEDMSTSDSVRSPPSIVGLVANVATRIRMDHKHVRARVEDPYTGGDVKRSQVRAQGQGEKKKPARAASVPKLGLFVTHGPTTRRTASDSQQPLTKGSRTKGT